MIDHLKFQYARKWLTTDDEDNVAVRKMLTTMQDTWFHLKKPRHLFGAELLITVVTPLDQQETKSEKTKKARASARSTSAHHRDYPSVRANAGGGLA